MFFVAKHGHLVVARLIDDLPLVVVGIEVGDVIAQIRVEVDVGMGEYRDGLRRTPVIVGSFRL